MTPISSVSMSYTVYIHSHRPTSYWVGIKCASSRQYVTMTLPLTHNDTYSVSVNVTLTQWRDDAYFIPAVDMDIYIYIYIYCHWLWRIKTHIASVSMSHWRSGVTTLISYLLWIWIYIPYILSLTVTHNDTYSVSVNITVMYWRDDAYSIPAAVAMNIYIYARICRWLGIRAHTHTRTYTR